MYMYMYMYMYMNMCARKYTHLIPIVFVEVKLSEYWVSFHFDVLCFILVSLINVGVRVMW